MEKSFEEYAHFSCKKEIGRAQHGLLDDPTAATAFLFSSPQKKLGDLFRDGGCQGKPDHDSPFAQAEEVGIENGLEEGYGANNDQQGNRQPHSVLHVFVGEYADREDRSPFRADGVGTE